MDIDSMIHPAKDFAELNDSDVAAFLRDRAFKSEGLSAEFKAAFPQRGGKFDIREICKHIVGLSNEQGGLLVYGVSEAIAEPEAVFPDYVVGLSQWLTAEDLRNWADDRVYPLLAALSVRSFVVEGRKVAIVRVPAEANKPYCYYDPGSGAVWYFRRTADGIAELAPDQIREFYITSLIEQVLNRSLALRGEAGTGRVSATLERRIETHQKLIKPKLENIQDFGFLGMYTLPTRTVDIPLDELTKFLADHRNHFSEMMRYYRSIEPLQRGATVGYFPRSIRQDIKSTCRITLYQDGLIAFDSQADPLMDRDMNLHPYWLAYEIQRHLQLSKAVLEQFGVSLIHMTVELDNIGNFSMGFGERSFFQKLSYSGAHEAVRRNLNLADVYSFDDDGKRNVAMPAVRDIMDEICRIFGASKTPAGVWDQNGRLAYVSPGLENQR